MTNTSTESTMMGIAKRTVEAKGSSRYAFKLKLSSLCGIPEAGIRHGGAFFTSTNPLDADDYEFIDTKYIPNDRLYFHFFSDTRGKDVHLTAAEFITLLDGGEVTIGNYRTVM